MCVTILNGKSLESDILDTPFWCNHKGYIQLILQINCLYHYDNIRIDSNHSNNNNNRAKKLKSANDKRRR